MLSPFDFSPPFNRKTKAELKFSFTRFQTNSNFRMGGAGAREGRSDNFQGRKITRFLLSTIDCIYISTSPMSDVNYGRNFQLPKELDPVCLQPIMPYLCPPYAMQCIQICTTPGHQRKDLIYNPLEESINLDALNHVLSNISDIFFLYSFLFILVFCIFEFLYLIQISIPLICRSGTIFSFFIFCIFVFLILSI